MYKEDNGGSSRVVYHGVCNVYNDNKKIIFTYNSYFKYLVAQLKCWAFFSQIVKLF